MLDAAGRFRVGALPDVDVYPDHEAPARFYAVPRSPRLAAGAAGRPQASLLLYGRGQGPRRRLLGGQVMLTTSLGLTEAELRTLRAALVERLTAQAVAAAPSTSGQTPTAGTGAATPDPASVETLSPDWRSGVVTVRLTAGIRLTGKPSLDGANECALTAGLSADQALALQRAWDAGLPDARIRYEVEVTAVDTSSTAASATVSGAAQGAGLAGRWTGRVGIQSVQASAVPFQMTLDGPMPLSTTDLENSVQVV
jgi:hypothetical protein